MKSDFRISLLQKYRKKSLLHHFLALLNMENLLEEKDRLKRKIDIVNSENEKRLANIKNLKTQLKTLNIKMQYETSKIDELDLKIAQKNKIIKELEIQIFKYENKNKENLKITLEEEYKYYVDKTNRIHFGKKDEYKKQFELLRKIIDRCKKFKKLHNRLYDLFTEEQKKLFKRLLDRVQKYDGDVKNIDKLSKSIASVVDAEILFSTNFFVAFVYENITNGFAYNFFSTRKTNRLDKPEWFVDFLIERLKTGKRKLHIYQSLKNNDDLKKFLIEKLTQIVNQKADEISQSESEQKKDLLIHFAEEISRLAFEIKNNFEFDIVFEKVKTVLRDENFNYIKYRLKKIHLDDHEKWFIEYQKLINEFFTTCKSLHKFDRNFLSDIIFFMIKEMVVFQGLLLKRMQFITKEETYLTCFMFSEIEELKFYIQSKQNELSINKNINIGIDFHPLSKLNGEVLKWVKSSTKDDLDFYLKRIKNFQYIQERLLVNTKLEISTLIDMYKSKMKRGYNVLDKFLGEYMDTYLFDNIILKIKFEREEFKRFKFFFNQIKENFIFYRQWKTDTGVKCVSEILDGKEPQDRSIDSIFNIVYSLYEDDCY